MKIVFREHVVYGYVATCKFSTLGKIFSRRNIEICSYFSFESSPFETVCMEYQSLVSGKNKKNIINLSSAELAKRLAKINLALS